MATTLVAIGTNKGLFVARSDDDRASWTLDGPHFLMNGIYAVSIDTRGAVPRVMVGADSSHWGPSLFWSEDLGATWQESASSGPRFSIDDGTSVERLWSIAPSPTEPDVVWAGSQPSALWRSEDRGDSFSLVRPLWDHPHRPKWGAGFGGQAIHTVLPHPRDPGNVLVAMSTGGVYRTSDGGGSWEPANRGIKAYFFPDPWPEFGQCVHKVARDAAEPDRLFAQNHHGVYRSDDAGTTWVSIADPLPTDFGFTMVTHPRRPETAYSFPIVADGKRLPPDARCRVFRTSDGGRSWEALSRGLPQEDYYGTVLRDAMTTDDADPAGVYFGTRTGAVYASRDEGDSWTELARDLPDVLCVRAAVVG
ncbi:hypothetical protein CLV35_0858 [Motilibacter peucedani]|uniref:BNR/Asp-box repeat protein n=1 Tax=Motilibacter peucedani TaxID=598650 RepID=A0A420XUB4_9ACTN|nr:exo-alpha-sialidase [Motilibacter peucedani]RKS80426.1 hypothetical protein CLV35_0858 [Motilibacter peucedani]